MANKNIEPVWQVQGLKSFCKLKNDWLMFDKFHLSFVKHEGKPSCKQVAAIEGTIKMHGADGALCLAEMILSGAAKKMAKESKEKANGGFAQPFFTSMGGTLPSRSKDGKCKFRQFSVSPGSKSEYVFTMMECEGEVNATTGGIQPVKNAQRETIIVPLASGDLVDFARSVINEHTAYRTLLMLNDGNKPASYAGDNAPADVSDEPFKKYAAAICDHSRIVRELPTLCSIEEAEETLKCYVRELYAHDNKYVADKEQYDAAVKMISENKQGTCWIELVCKTNHLEKTLIHVEVKEI